MSRAARVATILVSHDGARWLPAVLEGAAAQTRPADVIVAVDTGSADGSADLLRDALGADRVIAVPPETGFGDAVRRALDHPEAAGAEWIWLLHDDANPDPGALAELLAAAAADSGPSAGAHILGPKLREWPSLRRLLEVGVTISGTGRRETGLEPGEYDQGQHDEIREVLAVNTAGMLVRRSVLDSLGGLDPELPVFGNDLDLGWRAAAAGHRCVVVPSAVVFHAEAAGRGLRVTPLTRRPRRGERRAGIYTQLANCSARSLPFQVVWLPVLALLRALGLVLLRSVDRALDELSALASVYARPGVVAAARRDRRAHREAAADPAPPGHVRSLLAPRWLPYRRALDTFGDAASAVADRARESAGERRWPLPLAVVVGVFAVGVLIGAREAFGPVAGGALSPAPEDAGTWWRLYVDGMAGIAAPGPAYLPVLALLGLPLAGSGAAVVGVVLLLAIPVALVGAWRFLGRVVERARPAADPPLRRWLVAWGALTYALVPATSGAWADGRLGTAVAAALAPWLACAALGLGEEDRRDADGLGASGPGAPGAPGPDADGSRAAERRWRAAWRAGALLALMTAFAPSAWWLAVAIAVLAAVVCPAARRPGPVLTALAVPVALLMPTWWLPHVLRDPAGILLDTGRPPAPSMGGVDLLTGTVAAAGAPAWWGLAVLALAVGALAPAVVRRGVVGCWIVVASCLAAAAGLSRVDAPGSGPGLGVAAVVVLGAAVAAVVLGGTGLAGLLSRRAITAGLVALFALPALGLGWFVAAPASLDEPADDPDIPAYLLQSARLGPGHDVLVLNGTVADGLGYRVHAGDGTRLGEDEILALAPPDPGFAVAIRALVSEPSPAAVEEVAARGVEYVVLAAPADAAVAATLDSAPGLEQASTQDRDARAWRLASPREPATVAASGPGGGLVALQGVAALVVLVMCGPARRDRLRAAEGSGS